MAWRTFFLAAVLLMAASPARAQVIAQRLRDDVPAIHHLQPTGLARGQTVEVTVAGERLEDLDRIVGPPGVKLAKVHAVEAKQARVAVEVAADAPPGVFACYFLAKHGLSNPKLVRIDPWPQTEEHEDNNSLSEATPVRWPCGVSGVLAAADHDWFRFDAAADQRVVFDVIAQRLGSPLRPVLTLFDSAGRELAQQSAAPRDIAPDNRLVYTFRESGSYCLRLHDLTYAGADFATYQLRIGPIAFATAMYPLGGQRGSKVPVTFSGGTLDQPFIHTVDLTGDPSWQLMRWQFPFGDDVLAAPAFFTVGDAPEVLENEPNDEPPQAAPVNWPVTVNGRVDRPGDRDVFRFHLAAGGKLALRVAAQQLGSPVDALVTVREAGGKELLSLDDRQPVPREPPVVRAIATPPIDDPLGEFTATVEGDYYLAIEDRYGNGGPEYAYRLELSPAAADFELVVQPAIANAAPPAGRRNGPVQATYAGIGSGSLSLDRGGTGSLVVRAFRNGYIGPIELSVEGLPEGVRASAATIAAGQNEATINLAADFAAVSSASLVRIVGSTAAQADAPAMKRLATQPVVWASLPVNGALETRLSDVAVGVSRQGAELAIQASLADRLVPGGKVKLRVAAERREGYVGKIQLSLVNLPSGLASANGEIAAEQNAAEIELTAGTELTPGPHRVLVQATMPLAGKKEPVVATFPLDLNVLPLATVELASQQINLPQGGAAKVEFSVVRNVSAATA
ncbi:MAG TPA: PPC domain-containing protein, partial [Pirellulales bacterium]|nr:PPC domain-containing protein [Pirellulales bacterium]